MLRRGMGRRGVAVRAAGSAAIAPQSAALIAAAPDSKAGRAAPMTPPRAPHPRADRSRRRFRTSLCAGLAAAGLAGATAAAAPALAQGRQPPTIEQQADEAARAAREAMERAMKVLNGIISSIPQYEPPEVLPNGDIIIRRRPPPQQRERQPPAPPPRPGAQPAPDLEET